MSIKKYSLRFKFALDSQVMINSQCAAFHDLLHLRDYMLRQQMHTLLSTMPAISHNTILPFLGRYYHHQMAPAP